MEALSRVSNGDLRKAITTLQSAVRLKGLQVRHACLAPLRCTWRRFFAKCHFTLSPITLQYTAQHGLLGSPAIGCKAYQFLHCCGQ